MRWLSSRAAKTLRHTPKAARGRPTTREFSIARATRSYLGGALEEADESPEEHFSPLRVVVAREELEGSVVLAEDVVEEACGGGDEEAKPAHVVMSPQLPLRGVKEATTR